MYISLVVFVTGNILQVWELHSQEPGAAATASQGVQQDMSHQQPLAHAEHERVGYLITLQSLVYHKQIPGCVINDGTYLYC